MRLITLDEMAEIVVELFNVYVEPLGISLMYGQIPSVTCNIHRTGTLEKDWLARIRFKNTMEISVFRCEVYLEDIMRLCRMCKMWLITEDVWSVTALWCLLNPLYQTQFIDFSHELNADWDSMMGNAGRSSYDYMRKHFTFKNQIERTVLEILRFQMMQFTNHYYSDDQDYGETYEEHQAIYAKVMLSLHEGAYRQARRHKANISLIDNDGFYVLERITPGSLRFEDAGVDKSLLETPQERKKRERRFSIVADPTRWKNDPERYAMNNKEFYRLSWDNDDEEV